MNKRHLIAASLLSSSLIFGLPAQAEDATLSSDSQKFSYGIGLQIGQSLAAQNLEIDVDALALAINDALAGKQPQIPVEELQRVMLAEEQKIKQKQNANGEKNLGIGKAFLEENKKNKGVKTTDSGLQYRVLEAGKGASPKATDTVTVHYSGTLIDGEEFDSSYKRGEPATFPLNGVIKAWQEALPMMKEGGKWEIFVPTELAYGEQGAGQAIGPNQTLIFQIELLSIKK